MIVADVDGDRHRDIVAANLRSQSLSVISGRGDGTFEPARGYVTESSPVAVGTTDVNDDGIADLLSANEGPGASQPSIAVLFGNGRRSFDAIEQLPAPGGGVGVAVADFDEDALPDAVAAFAEDQVAAIFFGSPQAGLVPAPPAESLALGTQPVAIAAADFDADGHADIATLNQTPDLTLLFGRGDGHFDAAVQQSIPARARGFVVADFDADGDLDVAVVESPAPYQLRALRNDRAAGFTPLAASALPGEAATIAAGDFNGDGKVDLAVNQAIDASILTFFGDGANGFAAPVALTVRSAVHTLAPGDLNGDGALDLLASSAVSRDITSLFNDGHGAFTIGPRRSAGTFPTEATLRDLNNDGFAEAIVNDQLNDLTTVLLNNGTGSLGTTMPLLASVAPRGVATGDFDGDGRYDVFTVGRTVCRLRNATENARAVRRGDGNGDQRVSAADVVALLRELRDGDGARADDTGRGAFHGDAGADADGDGTVDTTDLRALLRRLMDS